VGIGHQGHQPLRGGSIHGTDIGHRHSTRDRSLPPEQHRRHTSRRAGAQPRWYCYGTSLLGVVLSRLPGVVTVEQVEGWDDDFREFFLGFSHWFSRADIRWQAFKYLRGLLAPLERRNGWTLAEQAGDATPDAMQGMLCSPCFDRDGVRDEVRAAVMDAIGDPAGVVIADETGFVKKGK
jgi:hypothetical protein